MAPQIQSPGSQVAEQQVLATPRVPASSTRYNGAIVSTFRKGPVNTPTLIRNERELLTVFGRPTTASQADYLTLTRFFAYGGAAYVMRVVDAANRSASYNTDAATPKKIFYSREEIENDLLDDTKDFEIVARNPGKWANNHKVVLVDSGPTHVIGMAGSGFGVTDLDTNLTFTTDPDTVEANSVTRDVWKKTDKLAYIYSFDDLSATAFGSTYEVKKFDEKMYNKMVVEGTTITLEQIGPKPGTSPFAKGRNISNDVVHFAVINIITNKVVESFLNLSKLIDGQTPESVNNYYVEHINDNSKYVFIEETDPSTEYPHSIGEGANQYFTSVNSPSTEEFEGIADNTNTYTASPRTQIKLAGFNARVFEGRELSGGLDEFKYDFTPVNNALIKDILADTTSFRYNYVIGGAPLAAKTASISLDANTKSKYNMLIDVSTSRVDTVTVIAPGTEQLGANSEETTDKVIDFFDSLTRTSYAVFSTAALRVRNRYTGRTAVVPSSGDIAGLLHRTALNQNVYTSPAGSVRGAFARDAELLYNPNREERNRLYAKGINPVIRDAGTAITLYGDSTAILDGSVFEDLSTRTLFIGIKNFLKTLTDQVLFNQNNEATREAFVTQVDIYLGSIADNNGIEGDFRVICDQSNNTLEDIAERRFNADIYIRKRPTVNFVNINVVASDIETTIAERFGEADNEQTTT